MLLVSFTVAVVILGSPSYFDRFKIPHVGPTRLPFPEKRMKTETHPLGRVGGKNLAQSLYPRAGAGQQQHMILAANERDMLNLE